MGELVAEFFLAFLAVVFWCTGEAILFLVTFGKHTRRWGGFRADQSVRSERFYWKSYVFGAVFWIGLIVLINNDFM